MAVWQVKMRRAVFDCIRWHPQILKCAIGTCLISLWSYSSTDHPVFSLRASLTIYLPLPSFPLFSFTFWFHFSLSPASTYCFPYAIHVPLLGAEHHSLSAHSAQSVAFPQRRMQQNIQARQWRKERGMGPVNGTNLPSPSVFVFNEHIFPPAG